MPLSRDQIKGAVMDTNFQPDQYQLVEDVSRYVKEYQDADETS